MLRLLHAMCSQLPSYLLGKVAGSIFRYVFSLLQCEYMCVCTGMAHVHDVSAMCANRAPSWVVSAAAARLAGVGLRAPDGPTPRRMRRGCAGCRRPVRSDDADRVRLSVHCYRI